MPTQIAPRWTTALVAAACLVASSCGASGSGEEADGPTKVDISGLDDGSVSEVDDGPAPTSAEGSPEPDDPGSSEEAEGADCGLLTLTILEPVLLEEHRAASDQSEQEWLEDLRDLAEVVPDQVHEDWSFLIDLVERGIADPEAISLEDGQRALDVFEAAPRWAAPLCPEARPSWGCQPRATFVPVGDSIDDGTSPRQPDAATLDEALGRIDDVDEAVELDRSDDAVLYGWLDGDGLVERTEELRDLGNGWTSTSTRCQADLGSHAEEKFEAVGEAIED